MRNTAITLAIFLAPAICSARSQSLDTTTLRPMPTAATSATVVPMLVRYDGVAVFSGGKTAASTSSMTFLIYKDEKGGEPLWIETQSVALDSAGRYVIYLGSTYSSGLPPDLFGNGEARWLEVQIAGEGPAPRSLLTSVPYALKAADAATLGGLPASAFVLVSTLPGVAPTRAAAITPDASASNVTTTGGTNFYVPRFNTATSIINSQIYDNGKSVGIGDVPNASARLDVNGAMIMRGNMQVTRTGNATTSQGYPSYGFQFYSNAYNSSSKAADNPYFQLQSEPTGNDTDSPAATFNLLFSNNGTAAAETGFSINPNGTINFASGQTFPSTTSSGTAVDGTSSSGIGVEGTSYNNVGVVGYSTNSSAIYGNTASTTQNTAGVVGQSGSASSMTSGIAGVRGDSSKQVGVLGTSDSNSGVQGISSSGTGVAGTSTTANGMLGYTAGGTGNTAGVLGGAGGPSGLTGGISGVWGDAYAHVGSLGTSYQYAGVQGESVSGPGVYGSSTNSYAGQFTSSNNAATLYASNSTSVGGAGVQGISSGRDGVGVQGNAQGDGGTAVQGISTGGADSSGNPPIGVYGYSSQFGVKGYSTSYVGVYGIGGSSKNPTVYGPIGVWGDVTGEGQGSAAVEGTATNSIAGYFTNNSSASNIPTLLTLNYGSGPTSNDAIFRTFQASTSDGTCGFGGAGNMTCTGQVKTLATTGNGAKTVETYSMQSPENWMEDFGSGTLQNGVATIFLDTAFAETVSGTAGYHVFLTPNGDSKGLYVFAKTAAGFEVRESGGGTSTLGFDYRIVAKRRGFEAQRMVDVTEAMKVVNTRKTEDFARAAKNYRSAK